MTLDKVEFQNRRAEITEQVAVWDWCDFLDTFNLKDL